MTAHIHHVHIFASDLDKTLAWWRDMLDAQIAYDGDFGGARNIFARVGQGRIHFYDQKPRAQGRNAVHHVGIRVHGLEAQVARMAARGHAFRTPIREFTGWRYIMTAAPDDVVLELFEIETARMPEPLRAYFSDSTA